MPYLSTKPDDSTRINNYISDCIKSGYPSVICKRYTKYADIDVMFDLADSFSLAPYQERAEDIIGSVSRIIQKHTEIAPGDTVELLTIHLKKREILTAEALASDLSKYYVNLIDSVKAQS